MNLPPFCSSPWSSCFLSPPGRFWILTLLRTPKFHSSIAVQASFSQRSSPHLGSSRWEWLACFHSGSETWNHLSKGPTAPEWQSCVSDSELYDSHFLLSGGAKQKQRPYGREELEFFLGRGILWELSVSPWQPDPSESTGGTEGTGGTDLTVSSQGIILMTKKKLDPRLGPCSQLNLWLGLSLLPEKGLFPSSQAPKKAQKQRY